MKSRTAVVLVPIFMVLAFSVSARVKAFHAGPPRLAIASLEHSFGSVKPGTPLTYTFKIKNEGQGDLEIKSVSPSCGCTTSNFDKVVAPGKEGGITLAVEKTEAYKGEVVKTATVVTNDPDKQQFVLTLRATFASE
ncbi:MAG TPA: DUF1573 domain-containing protein [Blastocatellia bacterium]|jgi:hypothetical protein|nr:DUF1573 domain-containing protein [Blastocatellia bacterium]